MVQPLASKGHCDVDGDVSLSGLYCPKAVRRVHTRWPNRCFKSCRFLGIIAKLLTPGRLFYLLTSICIWEWCLLYQAFSWLSLLLKSSLTVEIRLQRVIGYLMGQSLPQELPIFRHHRCIADPWVYSALLLPYGLNLFMGMENISFHVSAIE